MFGGIGGVLIVWIVVYQFGKVIKCSLCMLRIVIVMIDVKEFLQCIVIQCYIGQVMYVYDIIDIWMGWVKVNKMIDGSLC